MGGKPVNQIMGGVAQDLVPLAMMGQQGMQPGAGGGDPKQEEMMRMMAMLKAKGLLADAEGPITSSGPAPMPPGQPPFLPPSFNRPGMMG